MFPFPVEDFEKKTLERESEFIAGALRFNSNRTSISIEEDNYRTVLCWIINCLKEKNLTFVDITVMPCLDTIFDCTIMCNKYLFVRLEGLFSQLFFEQLKLLSTNINNTLEPIPLSLSQSLSWEGGEDMLNAYEMYLLAKEFNLNILASQIQEFIHNKRTEARNRTRMAFL